VFARLWGVKRRESLPCGLGSGYPDGGQRWIVGGSGWRGVPSSVQGNAISRERNATMVNATMFMVRDSVDD